MRALGKILVSTALLGATVASDIAQARPWGYGGRYYGRHHHRGGDGLGNFLLGAGLVGAIAVIASGNRESDREVRTERYDPPPAPEPGYDRPVRDDRVWNDTSNSNRYERDAAVDLCKVAAEREGERYSSRVNIGTIEDVTMQKDGGYRVTGIVDIDKAGYNGSKTSDREQTRFDCTAAGGRVVAFKFGSSAELAQRY